jgi:hypothetical protein
MGQSVSQSSQPKQEEIILSVLLVYKQLKKDGKPSSARYPVYVDLVLGTGKSSDDIMRLIQPEWMLERKDNSDMYLDLIFLDLPYNYTPSKDLLTGVMESLKSKGFIGRKKNMECDYKTKLVLRGAKKNEVNPFIANFFILADQCAHIYRISNKKLTPAIEMIPIVNEKDADKEESLSIQSFKEKTYIFDYNQHIEHQIHEAEEEAALVQAANQVARPRGYAVASNDGQIKLKFTYWEKKDINETEKKLKQISFSFNFNPPRTQSEPIGFVGIADHLVFFKTFIELAHGKIVSVIITDIRDQTLKNEGVGILKMIYTTLSDPGLYCKTKPCEFLVEGERDNNQAKGFFTLFQNLDLVETQSVKHVIFTWD